MTDWIKIDDPERPAPKDGTEIFGFRVVVSDGVPPGQINFVGTNARGETKRLGSIINIDPTPTPPISGE